MARARVAPPTADGWQFTEGTTVVEVHPSAPEAAEMPPGKTWRCGACRTRLRRGQPHSARRPWPHEAYDVQIVPRAELDATQVLPEARA